MKIGVDEVGRGACFGPVMIGACLLKVEREGVNPISDSKLLSQKQRIRFFKGLMDIEAVSFSFNYQLQKNQLITQLNLDTSIATFSLCALNARVIDKINIHQSVLRGMKLCIINLVKKEFNYEVICDGNFCPQLGYTNIHLQAEKKADCKYQEVMLAANFAKLMRDNYLIEVSKQYPKYGFGANKGYLTKHHQLAVARWGKLAVPQGHRLSFAF